MAKYRKKPIEIEAFRWFINGDHPDDDCRMVGDILDLRALSEGKVVRYFRDPDVEGTDVCTCGRTFHDHGWIDTLEGGHRVCPGDYIITGIKGEHYPCKPKIFNATYEKVDDSDLASGVEE